jgi:hypothetical protein
MTPEEKQLLLVDLCSRLPYGVIIEHEGNLSMLDTIFMCDSISISSTSMDKEIFYNSDLDEVKPYLFPLSSMTEEQRNEYHELLYNPKHGINIDYFDWCHKNHLDCRGLIPMGLAKDATGKNIY